MTTKINVFEKMQNELKQIKEINQELADGKIESVDQSENHREPLEITLYKEIKIGLSWGGPADGFKLRYYKDELQGGVYYWQDWGTYDESNLTEEEAQTVEDFYLYGDSSSFLQTLAYLRQEIEAERISTGEILELQSLAKHIDKGDTLLLQWASVPEFKDENSFIDKLDANIDFEMSRSTSNEWTTDYREGYIDGLKQAREMFKEKL